MSNFNESDIKREEFRKYLEHTGVFDAFTKVLVALYEEPEKPTDALEYIQKRLGVVLPETSPTETELKKQLDDIEAENKELREKLAKLEITPEES